MALGKLNVKIGATIAGLEKGLARAERRLRRSARKFDQIGGQLTTSLTVPLAAAGFAAVKLAVNLESSFAKIENLVGISGAALGKLEDGVKSLSGEVGRSQQELSEALFVVTSAGARGGKALEILESAGKASAIGLGKTAEVARTTTAILASYGDELYSAGTATNILTKIVREGNLEASELAPTLGRVVGIAAKMGVSFEEVGASIATFTRLGVGTEEAVTGITSLLSGLLKPSKKGAKALATVGFSFDSLRKSVRNNGLAVTLNELVKRFDGNDEALSRVIPNIRALKTVLGTSGVQAETYTGILKNLKDGVDIVDSGFENVAKTAEFKFNLALVNLKNAGIELGSQMLPIVIRVIDKVSSLAEAFANLSPEIQNTIIKVGALLAVLGPLLKMYASLLTVSSLVVGAFKNVVKVVGKMRIAFLAANTAMKLTYLGLAIATVAAAVIAFGKLQDKINGVTEASKRVNGAIRETHVEVEKEKRKINELFGYVKDLTLSQKDRELALKNLQDRYPNYLQGLSIEKSSVEELTAAQNTLNESILKSVAARKQNELLDEVYGEIIEKRLELEALNNGRGDVSFLNKLLSIRSGASGLSGRSLQIVQLTEELQELEETAELTLSSFADLFGDLNFESPPPIKPPKVEPPGPIFPPDVDLGAVPKVIAAFDQLKSKTIELDEVARELPGTFIRANAQWELYLESLKNFNIGLTNIAKQGLASVGASIAETLGKVAAGTATMANVGQSALVGLANMLISVGKLAIQTGIAMKGIKLALQSLQPAAAIIGGAALVALGSFVKSSLASKVPALAEGGLAFGPTLALIGDNRNAAADPEVVAPLSKLTGMMGSMFPSVAPEAGPLVGNVRIDGQDLLVVFDRAREYRNRIG